MNTPLSFYEILKPFNSGNASYIICDTRCRIVDMNSFARANLRGTELAENISRYIMLGDRLRFEDFCNRHIVYNDPEPMYFELERFHGYRSAYAIPVSLFTGSFTLVYLFKTKQEYLSNSMVLNKYANAFFEEMLEGANRKRTYMNELICKIKSGEDKFDELSHCIDSMYNSGRITFLFSNIIHNKRNNYEIFDVCSALNNIVERLALPAKYIDCDIRTTNSVAINAEPIVVSPIELSWFITLILSMIYVMNDISSDRNINIQIDKLGEGCAISMSTITGRVCAPLYGSSDLFSLALSLPTSSLQIMVSDYIAGYTGSKLVTTGDPTRGIFELTLNLYPEEPLELEFKSRDQFEKFDEYFNEAVSAIYL